MSLIIDPAVGVLATLTTAVLFAAAAIGKLRKPATFTATLQAYRVVPAALAPMLALALPALELLVALALLLRAPRSAAALTAAALLLLYASAIALNLLRGRRDLDCGCAGFGRRRAIAPWMLTRNALLAALALGAAAHTTPRPLEPTDALTVAGALAVLLFLYMAADQLFALPPDQPGDRETA